MAFELNEIEARVIGCLIEKETTTPDYYPLTLNALVNACNQKSNRFPVVEYDEATVNRALDALRDKNWAYVFYGSTSRVPKYKHVVPRILEIEPPEVAILGVLLLRGAQTLGEIRGRASRIYEFSGLNEVNESLSSLIKRDTPLVVELERQTGQKEARYAQLLSEDAVRFENHSNVSNQLEPEQKIRLEQQIEELKNRFESFRREFDEFKKQFE